MRLYFKNGEYKDLYNTDDEHLLQNLEEVLQEQLGDIVVGKPETLKDQLKPVLSNERLFFTDLYKAGVGEKVEEMFREMIAGPGAVRATIHKYVG